MILNRKEVCDFIDKVMMNLFSDFTNQSVNIDVLKLEMFSFLSEDKQRAFWNQFNLIKQRVKEDVKFTYESDPAANSYEEIVLTYPGIYATTIYRIANIFYQLEEKVLARLCSEIAHSRTGIDIHPGANISSPLFIDHGTGIVIGETSIIGKYVKIYQGVTLGAMSLRKGQQLKGNKRHPTIGDNVTLYANSTIVGGNTFIGDNSTIGANVLLTSSVAKNSKVITNIEQFNIIETN